MSEGLINPRKVPIKGEPDFTAISDDRMREYKDLAQDMIFAYKYCDEKVAEAFKRAYKQISDNLTDRISYDTITSLSEQTTYVTTEDTVVKKTFIKPKRIKVLKSI